MEPTGPNLLPATLQGGDSFGNSVSVSGDTAVIGAYLDDDGAKKFRLGLCLCPLGKCVAPATEVKANRRIS